MEENFVGGFYFWLDGFIYVFVLSCGGFCFSKMNFLILKCYIEFEVKLNFIDFVIVILLYYVENIYSVK